MEAAEDLDGKALALLAKRSQLARLEKANSALRDELQALKRSQQQDPTNRLCGLLGLAPDAAGEAPPRAAQRKYRSLGLFLNLLGVLILLVPLPSLGGGAPALGGSGGGGGAPSSAAAVGLVLLVPTTAANKELHASLTAQFQRGHQGGGPTAALVLVTGGAAATSSSAAPLLGGLLQEHLSAPHCGDGPLEPLPREGNPSGDSWRYHPQSHFTCKLLEGLCFATRAHPAAPFVAFSSEEALFRWGEFLAKRAPTLPTKGLVFTRVIPMGEHKDGLPPFYWSNKGYFALPTFNNSVVLSRDVATTICSLHGVGRLMRYGPPELFLGGILSTLEGLQWVDQESVALDASSGCDKGITITGLKTPQDWQACRN